MQAHDMVKGWLIMMVGIVPLTDIDTFLNAALHAIQILAVVVGVYYTRKAARESRR